MNNIQPHPQINVSASILIRPATPNDAPTCAGVGPHIINAESCSHSFVTLAQDIAVKENLILAQLAGYAELPECERAGLRDLLISVSDDKRKAVWEKCLDSPNDINGIQLFIDSGLADGIVNSRNSAGTTAAMNAVRSEDHEVLGLLLNIATIELNEKLPGGDTLLIRSVKNADMEIFKLLVKDPRVDLFESDDDATTAYENAVIQGELEMAHQLFDREQQLKSLPETEHRLE